MAEVSEAVIEAKSLAEARQLLDSKIPDDFYILSEEVLSDGIPKIEAATGETTAGAFLTAENAIPSDAEIQEKKEIVKFDKRILEVKEFGEQKARAMVKQQLTQHKKLETIHLKERGRQGFLGIGRSPDIYVATIVQQAVVEITYKEPVKIKIKMKKRSSKSELMSSLDELEKQTSEQWLRLDKPIQGAVVALMVMDAAFQFLEKKVSGPFNIILAEAKVLFPKNEEITKLVPLQLGPPQRSFDVSDIPLVSQQFKEAITRMRQLRMFIK